MQPWFEDPEYITPLKKPSISVEIPVRPHLLVPVHP